MEHERHGRVFFHDLQEGEIALLERGLKDTIKVTHRLVVVKRENQSNAGHVASFPSRTLPPKARLRSTNLPRSTSRGSL